MLAPHGCGRARKLLAGDQNHDIEELVQLVRDLKERIERLEQRLELEPDIRPAPPSTSRNAAPPQNPASEMPRKATALESRIGSQWLNRVGIVAVLFGVSFFLKYAFENRWIGPVGRVAAGLLLGFAIMVWSESFRKRSYRTFSLSLKAVATGVLYLSLWAAFQLYRLVPLGIAFSAMVLVTVTAAGFAFWQYAEVLALLALVGGFATPVLLSTGQNRELELFSYLVVLNFATLLLVLSRRWHRLLLASLAGTGALYFGWYFSYFRSSDLAITVAFASIFFVPFALAPLVFERFHGQSSVAMLYLAGFNAILYFVEAYLLLQAHGESARAACVLVLCVFYLVLGFQSERRQDRPLCQLHFAIATAFAVVAIAIRFTAEWITIGWFGLATGLLTLGFVRRSSFTRWLGLAVLAAAAVKVFALDVWQLQRGYRIVSFIALGVLLLVMSFVYQRDWRPPKD